MNRRFAILTWTISVLAGAVCVLSMPGTALAVDTANGNLIVAYKPGLNYSQIQLNNALHGVRVKKTVGDLRVQEVSVSGDVTAKLSELRRDPAVDYAEPNYLRSATITTPNDPYYGSYQWNMRITGANTAWDSARGSTSGVVAILDTGVSLSHLDLASKTVAGHDFVDDDSNATDLNGHGTHVAGIAAATSNNGVGVAGMDWNTRIMPVRVLDASGNGYDSDIASGIRWAADNGAKVINMSLGGTSSYPQTMQAAIDYAYGKGVTIVAAAGNTPGQLTYPAASDHVIAVAATDQNDVRATFSNYGSYVDVAAPGVSITSTYWTAANGNCYGQGSGTSMASPHVAGLVALLKELHPTWTPAWIETVIESTATDLGTTGRDDFYGYGRINVYSAVAIAAAVDHIDVTAGTTQVAGSAFSVTATAKDSSNRTIPSYNGTFIISSSSNTVFPTAGSFSAGTWTGSVTVTKAGSDYVRVSGGGAVGQSADITVNPGALFRISVNPAAATVAAEQTQQFSASAYDAYGNSISGLTYDWSGSGGSVAPVSGGATTYTAGLTPGLAYSVTATSGGKSGTATVTIIGPLDHLVITAPANQIIEGKTLIFTATGYDTLNSVIPDTAVSWWTTGGTFTPSDGSSTALTAGTALGTFTMNAANGTISDSLSYTVSPTPVHRFYNFLKGVHFYTTSDSEYLTVKNTNASTYRDEGIAFFARSTRVSGSAPVYRFYNFRTGVHFYTANAAEAANVRSTANWTFRDEGIAYYAYPPASPGPNTTPVYRFYNFIQGAHFYTVSEAEKTQLLGSGSWTYRYEGIAYYVPSP